MEPQGDPQELARAHEAQAPSRHVRAAGAAPERDPRNAPETAAGSARCGVGEPGVFLIYQLVLVSWDV